MVYVTCALKKKKFFNVQVRNKEKVCIEEC